MHMTASSWSAVPQSTIANSISIVALCEKLLPPQATPHPQMRMTQAPSTMILIIQTSLQPLSSTLRPTKTLPSAASCRWMKPLRSHWGAIAPLPCADARATSDEDAAADATMPTSFANMRQHIVQAKPEDILLDVAKLEKKLLRLGLSKKAQKEPTDFFFKCGLTWEPLCYVLCHISWWLLGIAPVDCGTRKVCFNKP